LYEYGLLPERFLVIERLLAGNLLDSDFGSIGIRQLMFFDSWELFKDNYLIGLGLGNWGTNSELSVYYGAGIIYPHNIVAELLSEHGIIGCSVLSLLFTYVFRHISVLGRAVFTAMLISLLFTGDMGYWHFLIALPLAISAKRKERSAQ
jgi:O-antigen ligase